MYIPLIRSLVHSYTRLSIRQQQQRRWQQQPLHTLHAHTHPFGLTIHAKRPIITHRIEYIFGDFEWVSTWSSRIRRRDARHTFADGFLCLLNVCEHLCKSIMWCSRLVAFKRLLRPSAVTLDMIAVLAAASLADVHIWNKLARQRILTTLNKPGKLAPEGAEEKVKRVFLMEKWNKNIEFGQGFYINLMESKIQEILWMHFGACKKWVS